MSPAALFLQVTDEFSPASPDPYILGAKKCGVKPENCMFEVSFALATSKVVFRCGF